MRILPALLLIAGTLLAPVARGINPMLPLIETFDEKRGFPEVWAVRQGDDGMTDFTIRLNPAVFLSHFKHGFPRDRKTEVRLRLVCNNDEHFKGPSVELGTVSSEVREHLVQFSVPNADLDHYQLDFLCTIPPADDGVMVIGGEWHQAPLKAMREAKETITENSAACKEMEALRSPAPGSKDGGGHSFGGGSGHAGRAVEPAAEK